MALCDCGCGREARPSGRFASDKCRASWHRTHDPEGNVRSVRRLANGGVAVQVHFAPPESERALHFGVKQRVVLGAKEE